MRALTCYMCDAPESSREHAPPQCLFPDAKTFGLDVRKNLITVPSCDLHNSAKSKDDEFFRAALTMMSGAKSATAEHIFFNKVLKAAKRKPSHQEFFTDQRMLDSGEPAVRLSRARFDGCVDHLMRALYFPTYGTRWPYKTVVASPSFNVHENGRAVVPGDTIAAAQITRTFLHQQPSQGENPAVFLYKLHREGDIVGFAALFYESVEVYVASSPALDEEIGRLTPSV